MRRGTVSFLLLTAALCAAAGLLPVPVTAEEGGAAPNVEQGDAAREAEVARQQRLHEAEVLAVRGRKLVAARAFAEARDALREAVRLNPDDAASRKLLSQAEAALGTPSSEDVLAQTRERHGFKAQVLRQQIQLDLFEAEKALKAEEYAQAVQLAERALSAVAQVDDAASAAELRARAEALVTDARSAGSNTAAAKRQSELDKAKARVAAERTRRARDEAEGLRALREQATRHLEARDYDKALTLTDEALRSAPGDRDIQQLRERILAAKAAAIGPRSKSRERRDNESDLMADIDREMTPLKPNVVVAADPTRAKSRFVTGPKERWELELRSKLANPVTLEFRETPLAQAIEQLGAVGGVNIVVDPGALLPNTAVTIPRAQMPLESMIRWVARFGKLQYCLRDGAVFLTGRVGTLDEPTTKMYDIATLLTAPTTSEPVRSPGPVEPGPRVEQVVEAVRPDPELIGNGWVRFIKASVAPETWERGDTLQGRPQYTIQYRNGRIVVVHTPEVQKQIEDLLNDFRKARSLQVHMLGRFITIERKFLDSLNISFTYDSGTTQLQRDGTGDLFVGGLSPATEVPALAEFDNYAAVGGLALRYSLVDEDTLVLLLRAVANEGKGTVLEAPRLTCYNTQRANIQVLRNRNYIRRVSSDYIPEIGNIPEGTIFDIQPFVSADRRYITLVCQPQMRTFVGFTTMTFAREVIEVAQDLFTFVDFTIQLPTTTLRSIGTTVTVPNGGTIIMGGFTNVQEYTGNATVPFIEGIPVLRHLMRGRDHIEGRRSLIMLITAETVEDIFEE
ncbi:MAG TPA: hypothetical protein PLE19_04010 [Planctomycetota bacterium]|nr:hypothetical protein [Planctomycetota bacterium]